ARELSDILVANLINLGNLRRYQKRYQDAYDAFAEAASLAHEGSLPRLSTKALVNALWVAVDRKDRTTFERWFAPALTQGRQLDDSHDKAYLLIALGRQAFSMTKNLAGESSKPAWITPAFEALNAALDVAKRIQDRRASSYALGYLGHLYEYTQRLDDALDLTRRAAFIAQQIDAPEILYLWQWQTGRILDAKGDMDGAITSYQNAIADLRTIRHELIKRYSFSGFNENVKPVFFELADLLLRYPGAEKDQARIKHSLTQALETLELLKSAELEDYFQDDCVAELQSRITRLDKPQPQTAVLYPILLEDRTELLLTLAKEIKHFTIPVNRATLTQEIRTLRRQMELRGESYLKPAQKLYDWLVRPMEKELNAHLVNTLVIVPDGPLRTIPLSTLHDGKKFLIERYALATTPGMTLTDPHPIKRENVQVLLSGLTEPVQGFPALPNVGMELSLVDELYPGALLIDDQFTIPLFREEMDTKPYQIVHMATHGQFESDLRNTFLLTFDDKLTMDRLEQLIGLSKFRDTPVELLILSACQTAAGDDRAALGLAGIAVKAGARSVLATLWAISDETAAELIPQFYRNLKNDDPPMSKAQALQQAQLKIIKTPSKFQHPFFWAPYLLIGNWL
ncbi:MAG: CHAT domain-containing protein, partial [Pseudomonadota bacterium]